METSKKIYIFLILVIAVIVCIYAQSIIIPFVLAILFCRITSYNVCYTKLLRLWLNFLDFFNLSELTFNIINYWHAATVEITQRLHKRTCDIAI